MRIVSLGIVAKIDRQVATGEECITLPYVGLEHVEKESGHLAEEFEPKALNMLATNFRFTPNHVLYGKLRPYLNKVIIPNFDGVCTTEILPILPNQNELNRTFLWAILLSPNFVSWASSQVSGANLPRLDPKLLAEYKISLPPLPEQQHIAAILAKADRLRRLRRTARQLADTYLQSVFIDMFGDPATNPMGWKKEPLGEIVEVNPSKRRKNISNSQASFLPMTLVDPGSVFTDALDTKEYKEIASGYTYFEEGDVLFAKITPCMENGNIVIARNLLEGFGFGSTEFHVIRSSNKANSFWLYGLVKRQEFRDLAKRWFRGTAGQQRVPSDFLETFSVPVPPIEIQNRFESIVKNHNRLCAKHRESERQAEHLFQSLLQRAFTGEL